MRSVFVLPARQHRLERAHVVGAKQVGALARFVGAHAERLEGAAADDERRLEGFALDHAHAERAQDLPVAHVAGTARRS